MNVTFERRTTYPRSQRIDLYAGDGLEFVLTTPEGLAGTVSGEIRRRRSDPDPLETFTVVSGEGGEAIVSLSSDQTAGLGNFVGVYDVQWQADESADPLTLIQGSIFCVQDVSRGSDPAPPLEPFEPGYPISETSFLVDGPLGVPWTPADLSPYVGNPPVASAGNVTLEVVSEGQTEAVGRPDLVPALVVGIRAASDWTANPWSAGIRLFLIAASGLEWYELYFSYTGTEWTAAAWKVTDDGATYVELIPSHTPDLPEGFPIGAAVALEVDGTTLRYRVSVDGDLSDLFELGANTGNADLVGPFVPAFVMLSDAIATGFFAGGPPED